MRSEQLEYVAAVARLGSFRRAADELHISQPALSATVRNLERELGVDLLERGRTGAQVSPRGRELLPHIAEAIEAIHGLRQAAGQQHRASRVVRLGTVNAATTTLLTTAAQAFRELNPMTRVEVIGAQQGAIHSALRDGSLDLGITTALEDDEPPADLETRHLLEGRAVVCMHCDSHLTALSVVTIDELLTEPLVMMRAGYLMHSYVHRLLGSRTPGVSYTTDGAEMGKVMVAEGLGVSVLPDFSVLGDPLVRRGVITWRPLDDNTGVRLALQRRKSGTPTSAAIELHRMLVERAVEYRATYAAPAPA
jgi:DNA-binding transcriptional LysR family regulator